MSKHNAMHEIMQRQTSSTTPMVIEVHIRQPQRDCPIYTWDRERTSLRLAGMYHAEPGLPADLAVCQLEGKLEVPVLLLSTSSSPPETLVQARLLGALLHPSFTESKEKIHPSDGWVFVAVAEVDTSLSLYQSLEMLPPAQLAALKAYMQARAREELQQGTAETPEVGEVASCSAPEAARLIRETRLLLKREQRM